MLKQTFKKVQNSFKVSFYWSQEDDRPHRTQVFSLWSKGPALYSDPLMV